MNDVKTLIESIKNPETGNTLHSENRIKELKVEENALTLVYDREGISPSQKRQIEDIIYNELSGKVEEDNIVIKTVSKDSSDVLAKSEQTAKPKSEQPANLKVGHGSIPKKKKIDTIKNIIAISSGKGGVGKSTVSVNLAYALHRKGKKVGLLDADIYGPSIPMLLGKRDAKPLANDDKKIMPVEVEGVKFISFGLFIGEKDPVIWRGPMLGGVLNQFLFDVDWGELDYLLIDLPPGTGDVQLSMIQAVEMAGVIGVSTPQDVALLDSTKGLKMFEQVKTPILGTIENMSYFVPDDMPEKKYHIFGNGGVKKASESLGLEFLGEVPLEIALRESCDQGVPYMSNQNNEGKPVWNAYLSIANKLTGEDNKKGFFNRILGK